MAKVKDLILYQVATDRNYKAGDKFVFGEDLNGQAYHIFNTNYQVNGIALHKQKTSDINNQIHTKKMLNDFAEALYKYDFAFRELAIEEVRQKQFPHLPSRMKCMFLTDNKESCLKNLKSFAAKGFGSLYQVVAVKVCGNVFYAKDIEIAKNGLSFNEYKELAVKYWSQHQNSTTEIKEILFEGEAEIVEILDEVKFKNNLKSHTHKVIN